MGMLLKRLLTKSYSAQFSTVERFRLHVPKAQTLGLLATVFSNIHLLGAWKTPSPRKAAILLNWGEIAFRIPVSNGDPAVISCGYRLATVLIATSVDPGRKLVLTQFLSCESVLKIVESKVGLNSESD